MKTKMIISFGIISLPLFIACATPYFKTGKDQLRVVDDTEGMSAISREVLLVADNQFHDLLGDTPLWRDPLIDKYITGVTIRPVQLDMYSDALLEYALEKGGDLPVIHLGDAADLACVNEFDKFLEIMKKTGKTWVMAPGNHDAFYLGNYHREDLDKWGDECRDKEPLTKDILIEKYINALAIQKNNKNIHSRLADMRKDDSAKTTRGFPKKGSFVNKKEWNNSDKGPILREIIWYIDAAEPWRSYLIQKVDLTAKNSPKRVLGVIFDTINYDTRPKLGTLGRNAAGTNGEIQIEQLKIAEKWLNEDPDALWVLFGHHPYKDLERDLFKTSPKVFFKHLFADHPVMIYVSAHTHEGGWNLSHRVIRELNIGSVVDWPMEHRRFQILNNDESADQPHFLIYSELFQLTSPNQFDCHNNWMPDCGFLGYRDFEGITVWKSHARLLNETLRSYALLFEKIETDYKNSTADLPFQKKCKNAATVDELTDCISGEIRSIAKQVGEDKELEHSKTEKKISILKNIMDFDRKRIKLDEEKYNRYRKCIAYWASRDEAGKEDSLNIKTKKEILPIN